MICVAQISALRCIVLLAVNKEMPVYTDINTNGGVRDIGMCF